MSESNDLHVMPVKGGHRSSPSCWCQPKVAYENPTNGARVWSHKKES